MAKHRRIEHGRIRGLHDVQADAGVLPNHVVHAIEDVVADGLMPEENALLREFRKCLGRYVVERIPNPASGPHRFSPTIHDE
jgi:hypothetical protein